VAGKSFMNPELYPRVGAWIVQIRANEQGMLIMLGISLAVVSVLVNVKNYAPRLMVFARAATVAAYFALLLVMVVSWPR
jgi:hypothetical protein